MANWAIHAAGVSNGTITNQEGRIPNLREGDRVLFFKRADGDVVFVRQGMVGQVSSSTNKETGRDEVVQAVLADGDLLEPARVLSDFTYSLERVKKFDRPQFHFRNRIIKLTDNDCTTLVLGRIFWSRTGFGFFINSLPVERLLVFVQRVANIDAGVLLRRADYSVLWPLLRDSMLAEYVDAHFLVNEIAQLAERLRDTGVNYEQLRIGIAGTNMSGHDLAAFYESVSAIENSDESRVLSDEDTALFARIDGRIERSSGTERIFENIFRATPWPTIHQIQI